MPMTLGERLGALQERDFRLLFTATTITTVGDRFAGIALAFAVLDISSATALGIVFAARRGMEALVAVGGGVLSDRLPRSLVLVGAALVQGPRRRRRPPASSPTSGASRRLPRSRRSTGWGSGSSSRRRSGSSQTVSAERLQQANALQGMTRNMVGVLGPAVGGAVVVAGSPGSRSRSTR